MWAIIGDWKIQLPKKSDFTTLFILKCFKMCAPASNTALCVIFIYKVFGGCHRLSSFVNKAGNFAQMGQCIMGDVAPLGATWSYIVIPVNEMSGTSLYTFYGCSILL